MADKANHNKRREDFIICTHRLFRDSMNDMTYGFGADLIADQMHTEEARDLVYRIDQLLVGKGYYPAVDNGGDIGYGGDNLSLMYYAKEKDVGNRSLCHYKIASYQHLPLLSLRIRNLQKCVDYIHTCPESIKRIVLLNDQGCNNRENGTCTRGQEYVYDGNIYWKCGCCGLQFTFKPAKEDIPHYLELVDLGAYK
jgi:hypothetical protein